MEQFVKANDEIIGRFHKKIEAQKKTNPVQAAQTIQELREWEEEVQSTYVREITKNFGKY